MVLGSEEATYIQVAVITLVISLTAVALRFWCKKVVKAGIWADDWWILIALLSYICAQTVSLLWVFSLFMDNGNRWMDYFTEKGFIIAIFITWITLYSVKMSVCFLYRRIFVTPRYRTLSTITMCVSTAWFIGAFCSPFLFAISGPQGSIAVSVFLLFDIILDAWILILPIGALFQVQMALRTKLKTACIFLLGALVIVTNILRLYSLAHPNLYGLVTTNWVNPASEVAITSTIWDYISQLHITAAILSACLPVYQPIIARLGRAISKLQQWLMPSHGTSGVTNIHPSSSNHQRLDGTSQSHDVQADEGSQVELVPRPGGVLLKPVSTIWADDSSQSNSSIPRRGILQTRDVDVV